MATRVVLKVGTVGPLPQYQDGDIVSAPSARKIKAVHCEQICHIKYAGRRRDGKRPINSLARRFLETTMQYKFTRNGNNVERETLADGTIEVFGPASIDVKQFLQRRLSHKRHRVFGADGSEFWFGGKQDTSNAKLEAVWDIIEAETASKPGLTPYGRALVRTEARFRRMQYSETERAAFLIVPTDTPITDAQESKLIATHDELDPDWVAPTVDEPEQPKILIRKRRRMVAYETEGLATLADIRRAGKVVDVANAITIATKVRRKANVDADAIRRIRRRLKREQYALDPGSFDREETVAGNLDFVE